MEGCTLQYPERTVGFRFVEVTIDVPFYVGWDFQKVAQFIRYGHKAKGEPTTKASIRLFGGPTNVDPAFLQNSSPDDTREDR